MLDDFLCCFARLSNQWYPALILGLTADLTIVLLSCYAVSLNIQANRASFALLVLFCANRSYDCSPCFIFYSCDRRDP
jgi:hypothetical protein